MDDWCSSAVAFAKCLGENMLETKEELVNWGECCGKYPDAGDDLSSCSMFELICEPFYNEEIIFLWERIMGGEKMDQEASCNAYCSEIKEVPEWCPSGMGKGALTGLAIGVGIIVVVVVIIVVVAVCLCKKKDKS
jgi:hypothetical protein